MLGETFEVVSHEFRILAEKVAHHPIQISCTHQEGENYEIWSHNKPNNRFRAFYGKGMLEFPQFGVQNVYMKKYDENITITKPMIQAKNLIFGGLFIDIDGTVEAINHKTKEKVVVNFIQKQSSSKNSSIEGKAYDANGREII